MSETNGGGRDDWRERFAALEKSHVQLMTDHEEFRREQDAAWRAYEERATRTEKTLERAGEGIEALKERINSLVSGFGEYIREAREGNR